MEKIYFAFFKKIPLNSLNDLQIYIYIYIYVCVCVGVCVCVQKIEKKGFQMWWIYYNAKSTLKRFGFNKSLSGL